jgi:hypothetical protein
VIGADDNIPEIVVASPLPAHIQDLTDRARTYIEAASSANTRRAYAADWKHFAAWCRRSNMFPLPPDPQVVGLYVTACASGTAERGTKPNTVSTIERRLSAIGWNHAQHGEKLDRKDRAIAPVLAGIRNKGSVWLSHFELGRRKAVCAASFEPVRRAVTASRSGNATGAARRSSRRNIRGAYRRKR